jgi:hypothetical protein
MTPEQETKLNALLYKLTREARAMGRLADNMSRDGITDRYMEQKWKRRKVTAEQVKEEIKQLFNEVSNTAVTQ